MSAPQRRNRHETMEQDETLSVELPDGIGVVHIRTGNVHGATGFPMVTVEVVSDSLDTFAGDGRLYQTRFNLGQSTVFLVGYPTRRTDL